MLNLVYCILIAAATFVLVEPQTFSSFSRRSSLVIEGITEYAKASTSYVVIPKIHGTPDNITKVEIRRRFFSPERKINDTVCEIRFRNAAQKRLVFEVHTPTLLDENRILFHWDVRDTSFTRKRAYLGKLYFLVDFSDCKVMELDYPSSDSVTVILRDKYDVIYKDDAECEGKFCAKRYNFEGTLQSSHTLKLPKIAKWKECLYLPTEEGYFIITDACDKNPNSYFYADFNKNLRSLSLSGFHEIPDQPYQKFFINSFGSIGLLDVVKSGCSESKIQFLYVDTKFNVRNDFKNVTIDFKPYALLDDGIEIIVAGFSGRVWPDLCPGVSLNEALVAQQKALVVSRIDCVTGATLATIKINIECTNPYMMSGMIEQLEQDAFDVTYICLPEGNRIDEPGEVNWKVEVYRINPQLVPEPIAPSQASEDNKATEKPQRNPFKNVLTGLLGGLLSFRDDARSLE